jgi:hypothetical protein
VRVLSPGSLLFVLFAPVADRVGAQERHWVEVASTPAAIAYVDSASLKAAGDGLIEVWGKVQHSSPRIASTGVYDRELTSYRINCATLRAIHLQSMQYKGQILVRRSQSAPRSHRWYQSQPGSSREFIIRAACLMATEKSRTP